MTYTAVKICSTQIYFQSSKFYDVNKLYASPNHALFLNKMLLLSKDGKISLGAMCI